MFQSMAGVALDEMSSRFSPFGFDSPMFDAGRIDGGKPDSLLPTHPSESQPFHSSFRPVNNTSLSGAGGFGFSDKTDLGRYNSRPSSSVTDSAPRLTHVNPAAVWDVDRPQTPFEKIGDTTPGSWMSGFTPPLTAKATQYRQKHGQITPPDDLSPQSVGPSRLFLEDDSVMEQTQAGQHDHSDAAKVGGTKRRAKVGARGDDGHIPKRLKKGSRASKQAQNCDSEEDVKREKFLERNRVAASKCRQKKKEWTTNLESRARELTTERAHLTAYVASLKDELLFLKGECLKHTNCGCARIREYLSHTVAVMAPTSPTLYTTDNMLTELKQPKSPQDLDGSVSASCSPRVPMSVASTQASASIDEDVQTFLSASIAQHAELGAGRQSGMCRR